MSATIIKERAGQPVPAPPLWGRVSVGVRQGVYEWPRVRQVWPHLRPYPCNDPDGCPNCGQYGDRSRCRKCRGRIRFVDGIAVRA